MIRKRKGTGLQSRRRVSLVVDIAKYSRRTHPEQLDLMDRLDWMMSRSFEAAGLQPHRCYRQNQGDGLLFVLPDAINEAVVVPGLVTGVQSALYGVNRLPGPGDRMRMRMAVSEGIVTEGPTGVVGEGVEMACRLVDSGPARAALDSHPECDLVFLASDSYFEDVLVQNFGGIRAADFRKVTVPTKSSEGSTAQAWVAVLPSARTNERVPVFTWESLAPPRSSYLTDPGLLSGGVALAAVLVPPRTNPDGKTGRGGTGSGEELRTSSPAYGAPAVPGHDLPGLPVYWDEDPDAGEDADEDGPGDEDGTGDVAEDGTEEWADGTWETEWDPDGTESELSSGDLYAADVDLGGDGSGGFSY